MELGFVRKLILSVNEKRTWFDFWVCEQGFHAGADFLTHWYCVMQIASAATPEQSKGHQWTLL